MSGATTINKTAIGIMTVDIMTPSITKYNVSTSRIETHHDG